MKPSARSLLTNVGLVVVSVLFVAGAGEIFLRTFMADQVSLFPRYHDELIAGDYKIRRLRPETTFWHRSIDGAWRFTTNAQGFRSEREFLTTKDSGVVRVVALGDSHTQGFEVRQDKTYAAVIEGYLKNSGLKAEAYNMGISGYSTAEALVLLEQTAINYRPDVVVLGFFANDLDDNLKSGLFTVKAGKLVVNDKIHVPGVGVIKPLNALPPLRFLSENSYFYSFFLNAGWNFAKDALLNSKQRELQTEYAVATGDPDSHRLLLGRRLLERLYRFCRRHNIRLVILDIPQLKGAAGFQGSVPPQMIHAVRANSDVFIAAQPVLAGRKPGSIHVAHGQRHISELTHRLLGEAAASAILQLAVGNAEKKTVQTK